MIDIKYDPGKSVSIKGHAGYAEHGKDIVCAAISALYCTMIQADGIGAAKDDEEMYAAVVDMNKSEMFDVFCTGMKKVAEQYPTYCRFTRAKINLDR